MSSGIVLPKEFGYPAAAIVSSFYLMMWQTIRVGRARKVAGVEYPQVYAEKAEAAASKQAHLFNCAQRAHQSTLEFAPIILTGTLITGLSFPRVAASLCGLWTIARVFYTLGYGSGDPTKRNKFGAGLFNALSTLGTIIGSTASVVSLIRSSL